MSSNFDIEAQNFVNAIKRMMNQNKPNTMIYGIVKTVDPLSIDIGNGIVLPKEFLFLGQMCRPHKVKIPHTHKYSGSTENGTTGISATTTATVGATPTPGVISIIDKGHTHDISNQETDDVHKEGCGTDYEDYVILEIEPALKKGDTVLMFAFNDYQKFYVAERIEEED